MGLEKISLMEAYLIETLRSNGVSNQELIEQQNVEDWNQYHESFDFQLLIQLKERDPIAFQKVIEDGYQVKFVTFNGLKNLLKMKFNRVENIDYQSMEKGIYNLRLNDIELKQIKNLLSKNWVVHEEKVDQKTVVRIELV